ncbi:hypothetical protein [Blastomonas aquatica]|uniref:hypothetical protein n=1 Tax=Blastomonas aquatica TaxID=1510276 RepID=UPI00166B89E9|nr:hypothetical protein [Blastomonas aquatica]
MDDAATMIVSSQRQACRGDFTSPKTAQAFTETGQEQTDNNGLTPLVDALDPSAPVARKTMNITYGLTPIGQCQQ